LGLKIANAKLPPEKKADKGSAITNNVVSRFVITLMEEFAILQGSQPAFRPSWRKHSCVQRSHSCERLFQPRISIAVALALCVSTISAQTTPPPAFDVASVKPNTSESGSSYSNGSKGQTVFTNVSLKQLILRAYSIKDFQLTGPDWLANVRFDITAKYPGDTTNPQRWLMLQTLLAQRFNLVIHRESKDMSAFALVVAKNGPKLEEVKPGGTSSTTNRGRFEDQRISMAGFADQLAQQLESPVVDKTGLTAVYKLKMEWTPDDQPPGKTDGPSPEPVLGPSIFTALQDQLGLKLQTQKLPIEIIIVDRVDRTPVEN
jgi:uncharacterized protein (TIGR03435 family)